MLNIQTNSNNAKNSNVVALTAERRNQIFFKFLRTHGPGHASFRTLMDCVAVYGQVKGVQTYLNICTREDLARNLNILADFASRMCERGWEAMTDFIVMATGIMDEHNGSEVLYV